MPNNSGEFKDLFVNHKKRRTIIVILLIILIILILLLISRCSYELAHGHTGVTGEFIGIETLDGDYTDDPSGSSTDTTLGGSDVPGDPSDDTTEDPSGGDVDPSDTSDDDSSSTDPVDTGDEDDPGDIPNDDVDTSITLRPLKPGGKVEFESEVMVPGRGKDVSVVIDSKFYQSRDLYFKVKVTKDQTNWAGAKLADVLIITLTFDNGFETFTKTGTFSELDGVEFKLGRLHSQTDVRCDINVKMDPSAGNEYINSTLEADFIWRADN